MVPLIGYVDRFSGRPSERIAVKVSSRLAEPYQADLVRIVHGDANPAGPGLKFEEIGAAFAGTYPSRFQPAHSGSYGIVTRDTAGPLQNRRNRGTGPMSPTAASELLTNPSCQFYQLLCRKWDQRFESALLQRGVCEPSVPPWTDPSTD